MRRSVLARLSVMAAIWALVAIIAAPASAASIGSVVGTAAVNLRSCPSLDCEIIDVAPLGESLEVTGEAVEGFVPVRHRGQSGYVYGLYLTTGGGAPTLFEGTPGCNRIALIFNVGIGDEPALEILDTLKRLEVPATLFPMGWWARQYPEHVARMAADGFVIGSHGDQPRELTHRPDFDVVADIRAAAHAIAAATGAEPGPWFTPYAAEIDDRVRAIVAHEGYLPVSWTVPANDYGPAATADSVYEQVMDHVYDGAIVELHLDGPASANSTAVALPWLIDDLQERGYHFVTIPQMADPCL